MLAAWIGLRTAEGLTGIGTCVIAAFALVAWLSLRDARRTRHAAIVADLSRRWDERLATRSREVGGEYSSEDLVALINRLYNPPESATFVGLLQVEAGSSPDSGTS